MAFMQPTADYFTAEEALECAQHEEGYFGEELDPEDYKAGWYACLHAPGYLDRTSYTGPFDDYYAAVAWAMEFYNVDENGDEPTDEAA